MKSVIWLALLLYVSVAYFDSVSARTQERGRGRITRCPNPPFVRCATCYLNDIRTIRRRQWQLAAMDNKNDSKNLYWYDVGERVYYKAKANMDAHTILTGNIVVTCLSSGYWSSAPRCQGICSKAPAVVNGTCSSPPRSAMYQSVSTRLWYKKDRASCRCSSNYIRKTGSARPQCKSGNKWTRPLVCKPQPTTNTTYCRRAPSIPYGRCRALPGKTGKLFRVDESANCTCNVGYYDSSSRSSSGHYNTSKLAYCNGARNPRYSTRWRNLPNCVKGAVSGTCPSPEAVENAGCGDNCLNHTNRNVTFHVGDTFRFRCNEGYRLVGYSRITCRDTGRWSRYPTCEEVNVTETGCPLLTGTGYHCEPENQYLDPDQKIPRGYTISCVCDDSDLYVTVNGTNIDCLRSDKWSHTPSCELRTEDDGCYLADIQVPANGRCYGPRGTSQQYFDAGERVTCNCDSYHYIEGETNTTTRIATSCIGRRGVSWARSQPNCIPLRRPQCQGMPEFDNGWCVPRTTYDETETFYSGQYISCTCKTGYSIAGSSVYCRGSTDPAVQRIPSRVWSYSPRCIARTTPTSTRCYNYFRLSYYYQECLETISSSSYYQPGDVLNCRCKGTTGDRTRYRCRATGWSAGVRRCPSIG